MAGDSLAVLADLGAGASVQTVAVATDSVAVVDTLLSTSVTNCSWTLGFAFVAVLVVLVALLELIFSAIRVFRKKPAAIKSALSKNSRHKQIKELSWVFAAILSGIAVGTLYKSVESSNNFFKCLLIAIGAWWLCVILFFFYKGITNKSNHVSIFRRKNLWACGNKVIIELLWVFALIFSGCWLATEIIGCCFKVDVILWYAWKSTAIRWAVDLGFATLIAVKLVIVAFKYRKM